MKPEPLKNKKLTSLGTSPYVMNKDNIVFFEKDIKSAVEWLKEKLDSESEGSKVAYSERKNIDLEITKNLINKAFEDVVKE